MSIIVIIYYYYIFGHCICAMAIVASTYASHRQFVIQFLFWNQRMSCTHIHIIHVIIYSMIEYIKDCVLCEYYLLFVIIIWAIYKISTAPHLVTCIQISFLYDFQLHESIAHTSIPHKRLVNELCYACDRTYLLRKYARNVQCAPLWFDYGDIGMLVSLLGIIKWEMERKHVCR